MESYMVSCVLLLKSNSFQSILSHQNVSPSVSSAFTPYKVWKLMQTCSLENIFLTFLWIMPSYPIISAFHPSFPFTLFWGITTFPSSLGYNASGSLSSLQSSSHDCTEVKVAFFPFGLLDFPYFSNIINYVLKGNNFSLTLTRRRSPNTMLM